MPQRKTDSRDYFFDLEIRGCELHGCGPRVCSLRGLEALESTRSLTIVHIYQATREPSGRPKRLCQQVSARPSHLQNTPLALSTVGGKLYRILDSSCSCPHHSIAAKQDSGVHSIFAPGKLSLPELLWLGLGHVVRRCQKDTGKQVCIYPIFPFSSTMIHTCTYLYKPMNK